jgi:hypothetical protein
LILRGSSTRVNPTACESRRKSSEKLLEQNIVGKLLDRDLLVMIDAPDFLFDLRCEFVFREFQIIGGRKIHAVTRAGAKRAKRKAVSVVIPRHSWTISEIRVTEHANRAPTGFAQPYWLELFFP